MDDTIIFRKLSKKEIAKIVDLLLSEMSGRLLERSMSIELTEGAREFIADKGFDPVLGARPLKRAIQKYIEDPLADEILKERFSDGSTIKIKMKNKKELGFYLVEKDKDVTVN